MHIHILLKFISIFYNINNVGTQDIVFGEVDR